MRGQDSAERAAEMSPEGSREQVFRTLVGKFIQVLLGITTHARNFLVRHMNEFLNW